jgi:hypothetical protein
MLAMTFLVWASIVHGEDAVRGVRVRALACQLENAVVENQQSNLAVAHGLAFEVERPGGRGGFGWCKSGRECITDVETCK